MHEPTLDIEGINTPLQTQWGTLQVNELDGGYYDIYFCPPEDEIEYEFTKTSIRVKEIPDLADQIGKIFGTVKVALDSFRDQTIDGLVVQAKIRDFLLGNNFSVECEELDRLIAREA